MPPTANAAAVTAGSAALPPPPPVAVKRVILCTRLPRCTARAPHRRQRRRRRRCSAAETQHPVDRRRGGVGRTVVCDHTRPCSRRVRVFSLVFPRGTLSPPNRWLIAPADAPPLHGSSAYILSVPVLHATTISTILLLFVIPIILSWRALSSPNSRENPGLFSRS